MDIEDQKIRPVLCDIETGQKVQVGDSIWLWNWTDGNWCCDCNRAAYFGGDVDEEMDRRYPGHCAGHRRFVAIDIRGDYKEEERLSLLDKINQYYEFNWTKYVSGIGDP